MAVAGTALSPVGFHPSDIRSARVRPQSPRLLPIGPGQSAVPPSIRAASGPGVKTKRRKAIRIQACAGLVAVALPASLALLHLCIPD